MANFPTIYPLVRKVIAPHSRSAGQFIGSRPIGVVVHYLADRDVERSIASDEARDLGYHLIVDNEGTVIQTGYLDRRTNHAGEAIWNGHSPNRYFAAVAVASWGELKNGNQTWAGGTIENPVIRPYNPNPSQKGKKASQKAGSWDGVGEAQADRLLEVLRWFVAFGVDPANVCGHDECALPFGRKVDPGGSLPWTMPQLRLILSGAASVNPA